MKKSLNSFFGLCKKDWLINNCQKQTNIYLNIFLRLTVHPNTANEASVVNKQTNIRSQLYQYSASTHAVKRQHQYLHNVAATADPETSRLLLWVAFCQRRQR